MAYAFLLAALKSSGANPLIDPPIFGSNLSQYVIEEPPLDASNIQFHTLSGKTEKLKQLLGKVVILNFWATWCLPCAYEIPSLDRLAAAADARRVSVIAVSVDQGGLLAVRRFLKTHPIRHLTIGLASPVETGPQSSSIELPAGLPIFGLPITYVIGKDGQEMGYIVGAARWDSKQAHRFLDYFISSRP